jgi:hypothetical protein
MKVQLGIVRFKCLVFDTLVCLLAHFDVRLAKQKLNLTLG